MRYFGFAGRNLAEEEMVSARQMNEVVLVGDIINTGDYKCRICMDLGDLEAEMCIPCECMGSIKYIHVTCLKEWIKEKRKISCELCKTNYKKVWVQWALRNKIIENEKRNTNNRNIVSITAKVIMAV